MYRIEEYLDEDGHSPFADWLGSLDQFARAKIAARILRFETGNLGDKKSVGVGVFEARIHLGPGYRIYFGMADGKLILLLVGGSKRTQSRDIKKAKNYWLHWKENK